MTVKLSEVIDRWIIENESLVREIRDYKDEYKKGYVDGIESAIESLKISLEDSAE
jgi:hypothetical protein